MTVRAVVWQTDWWTDVDDAVALRVLSRAVAAGLVELRGILIDTRLDLGPGSLCALLEFDGSAAGVPVGVHSGFVPDGDPPYQRGLFERWPHSIGHADESQDALLLYRRLLAEAGPGGLELICVGYPVLLAELLDSPPDEVSPLGGHDLVAHAVARTWMMAGRWPTGRENNFARTAETRAAASRVLEHWPVPITLLGFEVGEDVVTGGSLAGRGSSDPLAGALHDHGSPGGRSSWDPMLTWMACAGDAPATGYRTVRGRGRVDPSTGENGWTDDPHGPHEYVVRLHDASWYATQLERLL